jgi:alkylation response protein AidB-like acyl-CoA dehydrogenase
MRSGRVAASAPVNFEFSTEQELLRDSVRRFGTDRASIAHHVRPLLDDRVGCDTDTWKGLAEMGVLGLLDPVTGDRDMVTAGVVVEELGRALLPEPYLPSAVGAMAAFEADDDPTLIADIASGAHIATVAIHEPSQRYSWSSPTTTAHEHADGWQLTGLKSAVLGACAAHVFIVSAHRGDGVGLFRVDRRDLTDEHVVSQATIDGTRKLGSLVLDSVPATVLSTSDTVGRLSRTIDHIAVALAADAVGAASAALERTVEYAKVRKQFGVAIGSFQAVQHLCADMLRDLEIARAGVYYAMWACQSADDDERHRAALMAKAYASEVLPRVGEAAIQVSGGVGFTWEADIHLFYKRTLSAASLIGNADQEYAELADVILGPIM